MFATWTSLVILASALIASINSTPLSETGNLELILKNTPEEEIAPRFDPEDGQLTVPQLISKYGYPAETHEITTSDGYILTAHRIPYGKTSGPSANKPVIWLQHGLLGDSSNWIINEESKALGYMLSEAGFDIWLGNSRGNRYSKKHVSLPVDSEEFWDFSWNEMGNYDIPAVIDYVLEKTGQPDLYYIGHSMGTTMFFVFLAEHPEYNSKIRLMSAFAPVSYTKNLSSPVRLLAPLAKVLEDILRFLGHHEFLSSIPFLDFFGRTICRQNGGLEELCNNILILMVGAIGSEQLDLEMVPVVLGHMPAGSSTRAVIHYAQGINDGFFRKFDYGWAKNIEKYGHHYPPSYNMSNIRCPVALYWGADDSFAHPTDVLQLSAELPNVVRNFRVAYDDYNHMDFVWAIENTRLLTSHVMELLTQY